MTEPNRNPQYSHSNSSNNQIPPTSNSFFDDEQDEDDGVAVPLRDYGHGKSIPIPVKDYAAGVGSGRGIPSLFDNPLAESDVRTGMYTRSESQSNLNVEEAPVVNRNPSRPLVEQLVTFKSGGMALEFVNQQFLQRNGADDAFMTAGCGSGKSMQEFFAPDNSTTSSSGVRRNINTARAPSGPDNNVRRNPSLAPSSVFVQESMTFVPSRGQGQGRGFTPNRSYNPNDRDRFDTMNPGLVDEEEEEDYQPDSQFESQSQPKRYLDSRPDRSYNDGNRVYRNPVASIPEPSRRHRFSDY